jgi:hypothetical protein
MQPIGPGAGAAAGLEDVQGQQNKQADFLAQLLMHAQSTQAQREQTQAIKEAQLASIQQNREAQQQDRTRSFNLKALEQIPGGDVVPPALAQTPEAKFATTPQQSLSGTQTSGFQSLPSGPAQTAFPSLSGGGPSTGESQAKTTNLQPQPTGNFTKIQSPQEKDREAMQASTAAQREFTNKLQLRKVGDAESNKNDQSGAMWQRIADMEGRQGQQNEKGWTVQTTAGPDGKPVLVRANAGSGEIKPFAPTTGTTANKAVGATLEARLASAQAVQQTGQDIVKQLSDPAFASKVGPVLGRYNTLRDFIGNPPPEYAQLAGEIESYSLASMGVHGMRSAQGAEQIKNLLDKKHTPESMIATINGLNAFSNHFMQNAGQGGTGNDLRVGGTYNGKKILSVEPVK